MQIADDDDSLEFMFQVVLDTSLVIPRNLKS